MTGFPLNGPLTMSSLEIAERTGKSHAHVLRDIRNMLDDLQVSDPDRQSKFGSTYQDGQGINRPCFRLPKRECLILVAGYSAQLRAVIIDRWMEMEEGLRINVRDQAQLATITLQLIDLNRELSDRAERAEAQVEAAKPKVQFHDAVADAVNCQTVQEVAKVLKTGQNRLFAWLRTSKMLMSSNLPYQRFVDEGYFRVIEKQYNDQRGESHTYTRTLVTGKGLAYIQGRFGAH